MCNGHQDQHTSLPCAKRQALPQRLALGRLHWCMSQPVDMSLWRPNITVYCLTRGQVWGQILLLLLLLLLLLFVRAQISKTTRPNFTEVFCTCYRWPGSVLLWRQWYMLCTSGFVDDVMFPYNGGNRPESKTTSVFRPFSVGANTSWTSLGCQATVFGRGRIVAKSAICKCILFTIRHDELTCAQKLTKWPAKSSTRHRNEKNIKKK